MRSRPPSVRGGSSDAHCSNTGRERPLFHYFPALRKQLAWQALGNFPTPVERLSGIESMAREAYVKRDDLSAGAYGGNKVRTLEVLFGQALSRGATHIVSTGAFGSNHALATALHAPRVGLTPGALLFPQPYSWAALENLRQVAGSAVDFHAVPHWSALPFSALALKRRLGRANTRAVIMPPGGATAFGALGYVSAALELAEQVRARELPRPRAVVVGVGSTCTSAGLLAGFQYAARLGLGFVDAAGRASPPRLVAVRVTPWPVTSRYRIVGLAQRASRLLATLVGDPSLELRSAQLSSGLELDGRFLGQGYGKPSVGGYQAIEHWQGTGLPSLDTTYTAKAAAGFIERGRRANEAPLLFWSTKSSAPLPPIELDRLLKAPPSVIRWIRRAEARLDAEASLPESYTRLLR